jgi:hypothetical protein
MALPIYFTGTVSVAAGGTVVTGAGVMWSGINAKQGDFISINNLAEVLITEVTDATHLKIAPWQGPAQSGVAYAIYQNYVGRVVGVAAAEDVGVMLEKLHVDGLPFILGADETVPDPSYGDEGQLAFKPSTGEWWEKSGGIWVPSAGLTGNVTGPAAAVANNIAVFDGVTGKIIKDGGKTIAALAPLASPAFTGNPTAPTPTAGDSDTSIATSAFVAAAVAAAGGGSFIQAGTGAVTRTMQNKARDILSVKDFGAVGNGVANDTAAMQAAHNTGKTIYYPAGTYLFTPTITMASGGIIGDGPTQTILACNDLTTANFIKYTGQWFSHTRLNVPTFHNFSLIGDPAKNNGAGIQVQATAGETSCLDFHNVHFAYTPTGIDFVSASLWKVISCDFLSCKNHGVLVANTNSVDSGDSVIANCMFNNGYTTGSGIWQKSSGGLKVVGNKFLGGARGMTVNIEDTTSILLFSGNSVELMAQQCLSFSQGVAGKFFSNVAITGNQFSGSTAIVTDASGFLSEVAITGNIFNMENAGTYSIIALSNVSNAIITGNVIRGNGDTGASAIAVTTVTGKIGTNLYSSLPNPFTITTSPNLSITADTQSGTATSSATGWAGYGVLFMSANITVTFPRPFLVIPAQTDFTAIGISGAGEMAFIVMSISKTQCVFRVVAGLTGVVATMNWKCSGIL